MRRSRRCASPARWRKSRSPSTSFFLVVKAYDTKWACQLIEPRLAPDGVIVGLQNGMTHEDIAAVVGRERTIGAVIEIASNMFVPGVTNRQNDHDTSWFALGALDPKTQERVEDVADLLRNSGTVEVMEDIRSAKWMKLVVNAAELIPSAIINLPLADAARAPGMLEVMRAAGYEAMQAAPGGRRQDRPDHRYAAGHDEPSGALRRSDLRGSAEDLLAGRHADDVAAGLAQGRRAEVQEVNGWVVDILRAHGQKAPVNQRVMEVAYDIEAGRIEARPENAALMIETYRAVADRR